MYVSKENAQELNQLTGERHVYASADSLQFSESRGPQNELKTNCSTTNSLPTELNCVAEKELNLKVGAQVM